MEKQLLSINSTVQFQNKHGCMWGIFHMLNNHHWHNVKKVFPHKRHYLGRHARRYYKKRGTLSNHSDSEDQQSENVDAKPLLVRQRSKKVRSTGKSSTRKGKTRLHIENKCREESSKDGILSLQSRPQDFESSDEYAGETSKVDMDVFSKFKEHSDVVEVFRAEKDFLLKFLRDLDVGAKSFRNKKATLTKSGSFPVAASSNMNFKSRNTLNHKRTEIWAFPKGEKSLVGTRAQKMFAEDGAYMKEIPLAGDYGMDNAMKQTGLNHKHKGWNQLVVHRFKVIKQRIKHALMEFTKNGNHTSSEAFRHRVSYESQLGKEVSQSLEDGVTENISSNEIKASEYDSNRHETPLMRRTSSLNESMDRYTQLFERSFGKDVKWHSSKSKSLKVTNADNSHTSGHAPKLTKRNLSLPNIESLGFILHEVICDANDARSIPARPSLDKNTTEETDILVQQKSVSHLLSKDRSLDDIIETEVNEEDESSDPLSHSTAENGSSYQENVETEMTMNLGMDEMDILEVSCEDIATENTRGTKRNSGGFSMNDMEADLLKIEHRNSLQGNGTNMSSDNSFLLLESDIINDLNFKYVKHIMELSGFMENDHTQMWHTVDQPLKPSLCKETEYSEEEVDKPIDHQLLFDIVNESLLEIFEGSSTYFPRPFSFNLRLRPIPKGHRLLKEVWTRVDLYLSLMPELDQTLDDVVRRDLDSNAWMNLQSEEEDVALELEDMIVDDLLDEIIFSRFV